VLLAEVLPQVTVAQVQHLQLRVHQLLMQAVAVELIVKLLTVLKVVLVGVDVVIKAVKSLLQVQ
jgi:hypothetical protein